jgi:hypothetical protein
MDAVIRAAIRRVMSTSRCTSPMVPGRCTLTATRLPVASQVYLPERRRGDGFMVDLGEHLFQRPAELGGEHLGDLLPRGRRHLLLQCAQFVAEFDRKDVSAGGENLPELDERAPGVLQGVLQGTGLPDAGRGGGTGGTGVRLERDQPRRSTRSR